MKRHQLIEQLRQCLFSGGVSIGSWMQIADSSVAEVMGHAGYDWVAVDMEHGSIGQHQLPDIFRALDLGGTLPLARIAEGTTKECKSALDAGAGGVIIPMIESARQLQGLVESCQWPPAGNRGVGFSRANLYGEYFESYLEEAQHPIIVAMIESRDAVQELDGILQVKGLDAIFIGPYDLSASMGITGSFNDVKFVQTMDAIQERCNDHGITCGIHVVEPDHKALKSRLDEGYRFIAYSVDSVFMRRSFARPQLT